MRIVGSSNLTRINTVVISCNLFSIILVRDVEIGVLRIMTYPTLIAIKGAMASIGGQARTGNFKSGPHKCCINSPKYRTHVIIACQGYLIWLVAVKHVVRDLSCCHCALQLACAGGLADARNLLSAEITLGHCARLPTESEIWDCKPSIIEYIFADADRKFRCPSLDEYSKHLSSI